MSNNFHLAVVICTLLLGGCTVTGPADDGFENSNEWTDNGTLLSDEEKTIFSTRSKEKSAMEAPKETSKVVLNEKAEFEKFKQWDLLRTEGAQSAEYQEFLQWLKFQELKAAQ